MRAIRCAAGVVLVILSAACDQRQASPANPPGTATTRALDRAAGSNVSGAYPMQSDGMPGNPPGTAAGRAVDQAVGATGSR
jgi:hypothetical protein